MTEGRRKSGGSRRPTRASFVAVGHRIAIRRMEALQRNMDVLWASWRQLVSVYDARHQRAMSFKNSSDCP